MSSPELIEVTRRNARSVQTTIGWIFWDPGAIRRHEALGLPGPLGYIAARCAPMASAGPDAVIAAFGSISPIGIRLVFDILGRPERFDEACLARDVAVAEGLVAFAPSIVEPLSTLGPALWDVVDALPLVGRSFFGAHLARPRPVDPLLSGWHAINCLREWRGDTHWAIVIAEGYGHAEASILHNAWLGYERDWLARSRGTSDGDLAAGWASLEAKGLVVDGEVTDEGIAVRQGIEELTDERSSLVWELAGPSLSQRFAEQLEPACELLLRRVDETAGPNYQPASRIR